MALGLSLCLLGGEAMVVDRVVLANEYTDVRRNDYGANGISSPYSRYDVVPSYSPTLPSLNRRIFVPPEWAPWGLLSAGALTFLYATALPGRE